MATKCIKTLQFKKYQKQTEKNYSIKCLDWQLFSDNFKFSISCNIRYAQSQSESETLTSRMILTASRVFPSFRAHIANRRLIYTRMFVSRPVVYNNMQECLYLVMYFTINDDTSTI